MDARRHEPDPSGLREIIAPNKIGPYILTDLLGCGSFSSVKRAMHQVTREIYACKIISKQRLTTSSTEESFERELNVLMKINHPNVIKMFDWFSDTVNQYIILELFSVETVCHRIMSAGCFNPRDAAFVFLQLVEAVQCLHLNGVAHRDLKGENVLIDSDNNIKLIDFGFSKEPDPDNLMKTRCGTMVYTAPECFTSEKYNGMLSDIWSLGVVLYSLVTGDYPWTRSVGPALMKEIMAAELYIPPRVTEDCADLIRKILNKDPKKRPSLQEILAHRFLQIDRKVKLSIRSFKSMGYNVPSLLPDTKSSVLTTGKQVLQIARRMKRRKFGSIGVSKTITLEKSDLASFLS